jgi:molybdenum cofactor synthesis domain-containing protein
MTRRRGDDRGATRAALGVYEDRTGPVIRDWLVARGFEVDGPVVVPDGPEVAIALRAAIESGVDVLVTTGGTGISPRDVTPEATAPLLGVTLPGFHEELRRRGSASTPFALMSRGLAGIAGSTFVVNLPGSTGGVRDGLDLLGEVVDHVLDQLAGGHHDD